MSAARGDGARACCSRMVENSHCPQAHCSMEEMNPRLRFSLVRTSTARHPGVHWPHGRWSPPSTARRTEPLLAGGHEQPSTARPVRWPHAHAAGCACHWPCMPLAAHAAGRAWLEGSSPPSHDGDVVDHASPSFHVFESSVATCTHAWACTHGGSPVGTPTCDDALHTHPCRGRTRLPYVSLVEKMSIKEPPIAEEVPDKEA
ncbi:hypothetical protein Dimus_022931 [Dionaea muscipula]